MVTSTTKIKFISIRIKINFEYITFKLKKLFTKIVYTRMTRKKQDVWLTPTCLLIVSSITRLPCCNVFRTEKRVVRDAYDRTRRRGRRGRHKNRADRENRESPRSRKSPQSVDQKQFAVACVPTHFRAVETNFATAIDPRRKKKTSPVQIPRPRAKRFDRAGPPPRRVERARSRNRMLRAEE